MNSETQVYNEHLRCSMFIVIRATQEEDLRKIYFSYDKDEQLIMLCTLYSVHCTVVSCDENKDTKKKFPSALIVFHRQMHEM